jgi:hypothetical protein
MACVTGPGPRSVSDQSTQLLQLLSLRPPSQCGATPPFLSAQSSSALPWPLLPGPWLLVLQVCLCSTASLHGRSGGSRVFCVFFFRLIAPCLQVLRRLSLPASSAPHLFSYTATLPNCCPFFLHFPLASTAAPHAPAPICLLLSARLQHPGSPASAPCPLLPLHPPAGLF